MSKFEECRSVIKQIGNKNIELETNLYVFAEAQSCGSSDYHTHTIWKWNNIEIFIKEVGIHPDE